MTAIERLHMLDHSTLSRAQRRLWAAASDSQAVLRRQADDCACMASLGGERDARALLDYAALLRGYAEAVALEGLARIDALSERVDAEAAQ